MSALTVVVFWLMAAVFLTFAALLVREMLTGRDPYQRDVLDAHGYPRDMYDTVPRWALLTVFLLIGLACLVAGFVHLVR